MQYNLRAKAKRAYQVRSVANLLRTGHCAPTVMRTMLDIVQLDEDWLIKLTAGLPGGIGNTGFECGGVTAQLINLGLEYGRLAATRDVNDPVGAAAILRIVVAAR